jgi:NADH-quinone oxidoreductase subunit M
VVLCIPGHYKQAIKVVSLIGASLCLYVTLHIMAGFYGDVPPETMEQFFTKKIASTLTQQGENERVVLTELLSFHQFTYPAKILKPENLEGSARERLTQLLGSVEVLGLTPTYNQLIEMELARHVPQSKELRYTEHCEWIPSFGIHYFVGIDGLSAPLVFLSALLGVLCLIYSWTIEKATKGFFALFLVLITALIGVFVALDFFLFYVFWEVVLLPMYFLIGIWGGPRRIYAAIKFFIYTLVGSVLMLLVMIAMYYYSQPHTFNVISLMSLVPQQFSANFQWWIFLGLFIGFAIKVPVFPFHTWLPDAHVEAPTPVSVILAGVLLKMGGYGFFRFTYPLAPEACNLSAFGCEQFFVWMIVFLGVVNIVYGAFCALAQKDFKSLVAYSSISHMGYVLLGMAAFSSAGLQGAALQMFNHGLSSALMFFIVGIVYDRAHHRRINDFGGIGLQMPYYTGIAIVGFFASLGLPGLNGFISEVLVFLGAYQGFANTAYLPFVYVALTGIIFTAVYILWTIQRVYMGETKEPYKHFEDITCRECLATIPLALLCIVVGVYPKVILEVLSPAMEVMKTMVGLSPV